MFLERSERLERCVYIYIRKVSIELSIVRAKWANFNVSLRLNLTSYANENIFHERDCEREIYRDSPMGRDGARLKNSCAHWAATFRMKFSRVTDLFVVK